MKLFALFSIICLLLIIPQTFAAENETAFESSNQSSEILTAEYYFDANVENDTGNGSVTNPYKLLTSNRIADNSIIHLASGEYTLSNYKRIYNVTFIGANASDTVINFHGTGFEVSSSLTLRNVTLNNLLILNKGTLNATGVIFKGGYYTKGGAIDSEGIKTFVNIENCTFMDCNARYGGAIYISSGTLIVNNSLFNNTYSELYGGAIAGKSKSKINITNTRFFNTLSMDDSGGAIYIYDSTLNAANIEITNSTANFGGAITSVKSFMHLTNLTARTNEARYDGGAIYAIYREFSIDKSVLDENSADNGGAIYALCIESFIINSNQFTNNRAANTAGAVYSVSNDVFYDSILDIPLNNTFSNNTASRQNDVYESDSIEFYINSSDYQMIRYDEYYNGTLPSSYDLRSLGLVTPVKNQGSDGNCWAFAVLGALESNILKATGVAFDLSEENMKDLMGESSPYGWQIETNEGGYDDMGYSYLVNWMGPVNESDDEYKIDVVLSPLLDSLIRIQNIVFFNKNNATDNDAIKRALMTYGALACNFYYSSSYLKGNNYYYSGTEKYSNHAVVIVGWDDNREISGAPGKGAWIAKNSWGSDWKDHGYFYVSYYDVLFAKSNVFGFVLNNTVRYDKNYQYDLQGFTDYYLNGSSKVWYKNRYVANDNEYLAAVSTYFQKECEWTLSIYVNGELKLTQSGFASPSYRTIDLNQIITLRAGDEFEVAFNITVDNEAGVPISEAFSFANNFFSENMSFISWDGENWLDLFNQSGTYPGHLYYGNQVACIKAFTIFDELDPTVELIVASPFNPVEFEAIVRDQYGNLVKSGNVTFIVEGQSIQVGVVNGVAGLKYHFKTVGNNSVIVDFSANGYNDASQSFTVMVYNERTNVTFDFEPGVIDYNNKYITATLRDFNGIGIAQADVILDIDGESYLNATDGNGQVRFYCSNLISGNHSATVSYGGNVLFNPASANASVFVKFDTDLSATYNNSELIATLVNLDAGEGISGANVIVSINGVSYIIKTDAVGQVKLSIADLVPGIYNATISYKGSGKYNPSSLSINLVLMINTTITVIYKNGELIATLTNDDTAQPIKGANVRFVVADQKYTVKTNSTGQAKLTVSLIPGTYTATVSYNGNSKYNPSSAAIDIAVYKITTSISLYYDYSTNELVATLINAQTGKGISGANVVFNLNGTKTAVKTDKQGQARFTPEDIDFENFNAGISYGGNSKYYKSTASIKIIESKVPTRISNVYDRQSGELVATLINVETGKGISGANVVFNLNGTKTAVKTNKEGKAIFSIASLNPNLYSMGSSYGGNSKYAGSTTSIIAIKD